MNNLNIPICRAKKIDSYELVEGYYLINQDGEHTISKVYQAEKGCRHIGSINMDTRIHKELFIPSPEIIDYTTLAIHFPDMIDSQGNKIFASLSKDGKGGDLYIEEDNEGYIIEDENEINTFVFSSEGTIPYYESYNTKKVIGIQK